MPLIPTTTTLDILSVVLAAPPQPLGRPSPTQLSSDRVYGTLVATSGQAVEIPDRVRISRSASCSVAELATRSPRPLGSLHRHDRRGSIATTTAVAKEATTLRLQIAYEDEALCIRSIKNAFRLFADATSSPEAAGAVSHNSSRLAKKALRYRNLLGRVQQADLSDPTFGVAISVVSRGASERWVTP